MVRAGWADGWVVLQGAGGFAMMGGSQFGHFWKPQANRDHDDDEENDEDEVKPLRLALGFSGRFLRGRSRSGECLWLVFYLELV